MNGQKDSENKKQQKAEKIKEATNREEENESEASEDPRRG